MSSLGQFLKDKRERRDLRPRELIEQWTAAVEHLNARLRKVLDPYRDDFEITEWSPLLQEGDLRYNLQALTISFLDYQITVQPKKAPTNSEPGRVEVSCGASVVWFLLSGGNWSYRWEYPPRGEGPKPLTDAAIEQVIQELLS